MLKDKSELTGIIREGVESIINSGKFKQYLSLLSQLHNYSFHNSLLIYQQLPTASHVAGYRKWQELGRQVRKGEKAIQIFAPTFQTRKQGDTIKDSEQEPEKKYITGFVTVPVFDISQTDGEGLPSLVSDFGNSTMLFNMFVSVFKADYGIIQQTLKSELGGYTDGKVIVLNDCKSEEQKLKTLIHEISHCLLGHVGNNDKTRSVKEVEAEMTAFIVSEHFGIDSSCYSFGYLTSWGRGDIDQIMNSVEIAYQTSKEIISAIELDDKISMQAS
jgi:antirestriction protein ArdC